MRRTITTILQRLFWYSLTGMVVATLTIAVHNNAPDEYTYNNGDWEGTPYAPSYDHSKWNVIFDSHSHSNASDGRLTPEQNLQWHLSMGFNAMVLTDHNTFTNNDAIRDIARSKYNDRIKVLPGVEWTTSRLHMSFIYPPDVSDAYQKIVPPTDMPSDEDIRSAIDAVHKMGGVVAVCHPARSRPNNPAFPTFGQLLAWGVDYIESVSRSQFDENAHDFCRSRGIGTITATDMHIPTAVNGWTLLKVEEFTETAIFNELKAKRTDIVYAKNGSGYSFTHKKNPAYILSKPLLQIASVFKAYDRGNASLDWPGLGLLIFYYYAAFGIYTGIRSVIVGIHRRKSQGKN